MLDCQLIRSNVVWYVALQFLDLLFVFFYLLIFCSHLQFIEYGTQESILVLQTCFDQLAMHAKEYKNMQLEPIFVSVFRNILNRPNFSTLLCQSLRSVSVNEEFLESLCKALQLAAPERIVIGLALSESENLDVRMCGMLHYHDMVHNQILFSLFNSTNNLIWVCSAGKSFCINQIAQLCSNNESLESAEQIQNVIIFLNQSEGLSEHVDSIMEILSRVNLKEDSEFILSPLITDELREAKFFR